MIATRERKKLFLLKITEHISLLLDLIIVLKNHGKFRPVCEFVTQIFAVKSSSLWLRPFPSRVYSRGSKFELFCYKGPCLTTLQMSSTLECASSDTTYSDVA